MRRSLILFLFLMSSVLASSCGADKLKSKTDTTGASNLGAGCFCVASYSPVCGDGKDDFENSCKAQCFGAKNIIAGHCICSSTQLVCGIDGKEYTECAAREANVKIEKFVSCASAEF